MTVNHVHGVAQWREHPGAAASDGTTIDDMRMRPYSLWLLLGTFMAADAHGADDFRARLPEDEVIYFLLPDRFENADPSNDRGGLSGDRLHTGYDPTAKGFYHGGDL